MGSRGAEHGEYQPLTEDRGRITQIYAIRNPHKLERLGKVADLRR